MSTPRRLWWAMRAFPRRFRSERSAEIEATFHESELAGDRRPYGIHALVDVVLAGWGERARTHPPLGAYLKYRLLGGRLEPRWHTWMLDDLNGWFWLRSSLFSQSPMLAMLVYLSVQYGPIVPSRELWPLFAVTGVLWLFGGSLERRRILKRHGYDPKTRLWAPPVVVHWVPAPRRIQRAAPWLTGVGIALLVVTPVAMIPLLFPSLAIRSVTTGSFLTERVVDHTVAFGVAALAAGVVTLIVGIATRRWIAVRTLVPANELDPKEYVVVPAGRAVWIVPPALVVVGVSTSLLPIAPLAIPAAFLAAGMASPVLLVLARIAHQLDGDGHGPVGFSTAPRGANVAVARR